MKNLRNKTIGKIRKKILNEYGLDCLMLPSSYDRANFLYALQEEPIHFSGDVLIIKNSEVTLLTSRLSAKSLPPLEGITIKTYDNLMVSLKKELAGCFKVGISKKKIPCSFYESLKDVALFVDVTQELQNLRAIKEEEEVELISKANKITKEVLEEIYSINLESFSEVSLKTHLENLAVELGSPGFSFDTIVAFDENTSKPHYKTSGRKKVAKRVILIDIGVKFDIYTADVTRFFILNNDSEIKSIARKLLELQGELILNLRECMEALELERLYEKKLKENGFEVYHSLGHGIGVEVHESPFFKTTTTLTKGMVFTIEPGIYLDGFGLRFEDNVFLLERPKILSNFLRELDELVI